jgi:hypothetical protein
MKLSIAAWLDYEFSEPTDVLLQIEAAAIPEQLIDVAVIDVPNSLHFARVAAQDAIGERIWLRVEERLRIASRICCRPAIVSLISSILS